MSSQDNEKLEIQEKTGLQIYTSRPWEFLKTVFLLITWIILGMHAELVGPTLKILALQTGVTFTGISTILAARSGGYMTGNIVGAVIQKIVKRYPEALLAIGYLITSAVIFVTPHIDSLLVLSIVFFCQGVSHGFIDISGTSLILSMWNTHSSTPLNSVHLGFGFGAVAANILVSQFHNSEQSETSYSNFNSTLQSLSVTSSTNIKIPYSIAAALGLLIAIGHLIFAIAEHRTRSKTRQMQQLYYTIVGSGPFEEVQLNHSHNSPKKQNNNHLYYTVFISIVWAAHMFFVIAIDQIFGKFFFSYLKSAQFEVSTENAFLSMILYWLSYSIGRLICAIVTLFISVDATLMTLWTIGLTLAITWIMYVWTIGLSIYSLFVLGSFTGLVFSPIFPLSFSFINQRLNVTPLLLGVFLCSASLGGMTFQKLAGVLMDDNPKHFPTLLIICVLMAIIFYVFTFCISLLHRRRSTITL